MDSKARAVAVRTVMARCAGAHEFELAVEHSSVLAVITAVAIVAITMVLLLTARDGLRLWPRSDDHRQAVARPRTSDMAVQTSADWCVRATPKAAIVWYRGPLFMTTSGECFHIDKKCRHLRKVAVFGGNRRPCLDCVGCAKLG